MAFNTEHQKSTSFGFLYRLWALFLIVILLSQSIEAFASETIEEATEPAPSEISSIPAVALPVAQESDDVEVVEEVESVTLEESVVSQTDETEESRIDAQTTSTEPNESASESAEVQNFEQEASAVNEEMDTQPSEPSEHEVDESVVREEEPDSVGEQGTTTEEIRADAEEDINTSPETIPTPVPQTDATSHEEDLGAEEATSTIQEGPQLAEVHTINTNDNRYQFGADDCVTVEGGFFYCTSEAAKENVLPESVYTALDDEGDYEIYIAKEGKVHQVTNNQTDDSAPYYDASLDRIVWHSSINDRYQIMLYEIETNAMVQLTDDSFNNMEPVIVGERIVWQAWIDSNWEIIFEENGERLRLTQNEQHDIDPSIRGDLISWQRQTPGGWDIVVFDINTKEVKTLSDLGGSTVSNPRMVLVYDSQTPEGDTKTIGYDLEKGTIISLSAIPKEVPKEIPEPEHTKEERALVQPQTPLKQEEVESDDDVQATSTPSIPPPDPVNEVIASSSEQFGEIVIPPLTTVDESVVEYDHIPDVDLRSEPESLVNIATSTIPDLVIRPHASTTEVNGV